MLNGVRVFDMSRLLPGPAATWYLQGMGAQVDRVEPPGGDLTRHMPPMVDGSGVYFSSLSRGKRSIVINLRKEGASDLIEDMLGFYDVLVEGFKPGTLEKIGINPEKLLERYPALIIARLSGYGQTGPWAQRVGHDVNYVGLSGILSGHKITDDGIALPAAQLADLGGAMSAAMGICAALYERQKTGRGRILDVSLAESAMSIWAPMITGLNAQGREPKPGAEILTGGSSVYGTFQCSDGKWISVGVIEAKFQAALKSICGSLERDKLKEFFLLKPRDHWVDVLEKACVAPVLGVCELEEHPQHKARGAIKEGYVRPPFGAVCGAVPTLGENTVEILQSCSISAERIDELRNNGLIQG